LVFSLCTPAAASAAVDTTTITDTTSIAATESLSEASSLGTVSSSLGGTVTAKTTDATCQAARAATGEAGSCAAQMTGSVGARTAATKTQLVADGDLVSADGTRLADVAASGSTIYTRTWWEEKRGLYYINWWEKHTGRIYWHSGHVWSTVGAHGYTGNHQCDQGGGLGYDIRVTNCFTERRDVTFISEWDYWKVYVLYKGFPLSASHNMHANGHSSGNIYFY
jgi:hypothetical protein